ncbi:hypothetical protein LQ764DRAFT_222240 [Zygosaccharomyces rouxii]|nr:hypothetical protein LQ764DRAFT_222240 [Zygosaccharomyces rouxii]
MFYEMSKHCFPSVVSCTFCVIAWVAFSMDASYQNVPGFYTNGRVVFEFVFCSPLGGSIIRNRIPYNIVGSCLYQEHIWNTPYFFYDGQRVQLNFRDNVLRPYLKGKFEGVADVDKIQSARLYLKSVNENFKLSLKDNLPESFLNSEQPRDTYRNKSMLHSRYLFMGIIFLQRQYQILLGIVMGFFQKLFFTLFCCIFWDQIFSEDNWSFYWLVYPEMDIMKAMEFLAIITKVSSGKELDQWDQITKYTNQYLKGEIAAILGRYFSTDCFGPLSVENSLVYGELKEIVEFTKRSKETNKSDFLLST